LDTGGNTGLGLMARFVAGAVFGLVVGVVAAAAAGLHAEDLDGVHADTISAANEAGVDLVDLLGAIATTGLPARPYLQMTGELSRPSAPPPARDALDTLVDCLAWHESRGFAGAYNRRSGASGLLQFMPSTFAQTPQGKAGLSVFDPVAARAAAKWMIGQGRLHEWATWRSCA
jgi:Transglycosylase SLT domain